MVELQEKRSYQKRFLDKIAERTQKRSLLPEELHQKLIHQIYSKEAQRRAQLHEAVEGVREAVENRTDVFFGKDIPGLKYGKVTNWPDYSLKRIDTPDPKQMLSSLVDRIQEIISISNLGDVQARIETAFRREKEEGWVNAMFDLNENWKIRFHTEKRGKESFLKVALRPKETPEFIQADKKDQTDRVLEQLATKGKETFGDKLVQNSKENYQATWLEIIKPWFSQEYNISRKKIIQAVEQGGRYKHLDRDQLAEYEVKPKKGEIFFIPTDEGANFVISVKREGNLLKMAAHLNKDIVQRAKEAFVDGVVDDALKELKRRKQRAKQMPGIQIDLSPSVLINSVFDTRSTSGKIPNYYLYTNSTWRSRATRDSLEEVLSAVQGRMPNQIRTAISEARKIKPGNYVELRRVIFSGEKNEYELKPLRGKAGERASYEILFSTLG